MASKKRGEISKGRTAAQQNLVSVTRAEAKFSGPLPPPETLAAYNNAFEGCAQRIVALAEQQSEHRQKIEAKVVQSNIRNERLGQIIAAVLFSLGMVAGTFLIFNDKDAIGITALTASLVAPAGLYIYSDRRKSKQLKTKWEQLVGGEAPAEE